MRNFILLIFLLLLELLVTYGQNKKAVQPPLNGDTLIQINSPEQSRLDLSLTDGGLAPLPGTTNIQLLRVTRDQPELSDGDGYTYAHHMDLAEWRGRLYAAWNMTEKDEDVPPSKVVYSSSADGMQWSKPQDLFPRQWSWPCRFYFYRSTNDRMLAFCAAKRGDGNISESLKSVLLVREILSDHQLGPVYTLIHPATLLPPSFETAHDRGFVAACREAANHKMLLEQQDYGVFLGDKKMIWHEKTLPYKGFYKFGKALCFYQRKDHQWVGLSKMGFATLSSDGGQTWSSPILPPTLQAGSAKVWGQATHDSTYLLAYNPDPQKGKRYPLVGVRGSDGIHFGGMRVIHGEFPPLRYPGKYKDLGYQYVRGIAPWSTDHSFPDKNSVWLIYSVHKEDIWIARIPLPWPTISDLTYRENFEKSNPGTVVKDWNIYSPSWAPVQLIQEPERDHNMCLQLQDGDPVDYARAMRLFPSSPAVKIAGRFKALNCSAPLEIEIQDSRGLPVVGFRLATSGIIEDINGEISSQRPVILGQWVSFKIEVTQHKANLTFGNSKWMLTQMGSSRELSRLVFRTGAYRKVTTSGSSLTLTDKRSSEPARYLIDDIKIKTSR